MALKKLFGKKESEGTTEISNTQANTDSVDTVIDTPEEQTATTAEQEGQAVDQEKEQPKDKTASVAEENKEMADETKSDANTAGEEKKNLRPVIRPHAFVVMPFGKKKGANDLWYDFNEIYETLIKPALELAGFEPFRADEAKTSGDILTDMFQELLLADMVLADLSIDNANAFYELGIRHAFKKRGIVHIQAGRAYMPFDIFNVRTLPYHVTDQGVPDPAFKEKDIKAITRMTRDTWASDRDAIHSPIFNLLPGLKEPDQKDLHTPLATGYWREYDDLKSRIAIAQRQKRIGDILLLTEEVSNPLFKEEAITQAGKALADMGRNELALAQYRKGLDVNPDNLFFRQQEAFHLNRLKKVDEAIVKIENILIDHPNDGESAAYLGRIYKDMWVESWNWVQDPEKRLRTAFESYHWLMKSYQIYLQAFRTDLDKFYPGGNALTLASILVTLADKFDDKEDPDPEIEIIRTELPELRGTLEFALTIQAASPKADYWTLASLADLYVLTSEHPQRVVRAYRKAMTASRRATFYLDSSIQQLEILKSLDMLHDNVAAGIQVLKEELARVHKMEYTEESEDVEADAVHEHKTGSVFLFSGYVISGADNKGAFPANAEEDIRLEIEQTLNNLGAGPEDLAILAGMAAGSDLLFIEACIARGIPVATHMPIAESVYVNDFVSSADGNWVERFYKARNHPLVDEFYQADLVGEAKPSDDVFERNNRWALYSAMVRGIDNLRLIALCDDKRGDIHDTRDAHLVKHMIDLTREAGGQVEIINPSKIGRIVVGEKPRIKRATSPKKQKPKVEKKTEEAKDPE